MELSLNIAFIIQGLIVALAIWYFQRQSTMFERVTKLESAASALAHSIEDRIDALRQTLGEIQEELRWLRRNNRKR